MAHEIRRSPVKKIARGRMLKRGLMIAGLAALAGASPMRARAQSNYLHFALTDHVTRIPAQEINEEIEAAKRKKAPFNVLLLEAADLQKANRLKEEAWYNEKIREGRDFYLRVAKVRGLEVADQSLAASAAKLFGEEFGATLFCGAVKGNLLLKYAEEREGTNSFNEVINLNAKSDAALEGMNWNAPTKSLLASIKKGMYFAQKSDDIRDAGIADRIKKALVEVRTENPSLAKKDIKGLVVLGAMHGSVMGRVNGQQKIAVSRLERKSIVADLNHEIQDELAAEGKRLDSDDCVNRLFLSVVFIPFYQNALKSGRILDAVKIRNVILRLPNDKIASAIEANSNLTGRARMLGITRTLNIPVSESN